MSGLTSIMVETVSIYNAHQLAYLAVGLSVIYILAVRKYRYQRASSAETKYYQNGRPLSEMTVKEAHEVVRNLRELEFPFSMHLSMKLSLLKTGSIPTMAKLFVATRQLKDKNASKRAADTEIILNEVHDREPGSDSHLLGISRMNYLHARFRKAGKILDDDMLHTLGSAVLDIFQTIGSIEWRDLTNVEKCAIGVFHKALGDAMEIPFTHLPSQKDGWRDGTHFAEEIMDWTLKYERRVAEPTNATREIGRQLMNLATFHLPSALKPFGERMIASRVEGYVQESMGFRKPTSLHYTLMGVVFNVRKFILRYLSFPRPESKKVHMLSSSPDPVTGLYTANFWIAHPWYVKPTFSNRWGFKAILAWTTGGTSLTDGGLWRADGYDLRTIGPTAQETRGADEMEEIFADLKKQGYADGCPFHS
ncbi:hypothetical protein PENVUL_c026G06935 [Penicillium vulpinum]|uniref:ER-bound oxygenase mpaB/mpaB'/Rubber oxygenase catalytic domain-containing protein n=2 Tax=Penicillium vulpinum TaxID=29845 RepID=A0A1V6RUG5_9EURO|nr:hypothetical protein PENVUL_c026G06935 [Penicillium vulpinum]